MFCVLKKRHIVAYNIWFGREIRKLFLLRTLKLNFLINNNSDKELKDSMVNVCKDKLLFLSEYLFDD